MRSHMIRAGCGVIGLLMVAACDARSSTTPMSPTPVRRTPGPEAWKPALGLGEPRIPQPFTMEQRLLDAASRGDRQTIERAFERGAALGTKDDLGRSLVLLAVLDAGNLELVRWLHSKGATLDDPDVGGRTPLSFAAANGRLDLVRYLVENGAAVDRVDVQQRTPLFHAATGNHPQVVTFLLDRRADVNVRDQFGDTPLIIACSRGNGEVAALLLQRGADPALKDQEGRTARDRAAPGTAACTAPDPKTP